MAVCATTADTALTQDSRTGMTIPVVPEICSTARIIRPEPPHAVSNSVTGRRPVRHRRRIIARSVVARTVGGGQRSAYDCPGAPHPQPPPLHCTDWVIFGTALMRARGSPMGAAVAAPADTTTLLASKADKARIRIEVDIVVPSRSGVRITLIEGMSLLAPFRSIESRLLPGGFVGTNDLQDPKQRMTERPTNS